VTDVFRDPAQPVAARADDLLGRLTLREKVGQLNQRLLGWDAWSRDGSSRAGSSFDGSGYRPTPELAAEIDRWGGIGAIYGMQRADAWSGKDWANGADPASSYELAAMVQEQVVAGSRLGLPALFVEEASHGHQALGAQLHPTHIGAAASWQPSLIEEAAAHTAAELRARGAHLALMSGLDMLRDPRWGRAEECLGEDPLLASLFVRALVRGMRREPGLGVVLKHFAGQGAAMGGRNGSGAAIGPRELAEIHLPAARAGVAAGAEGVMAAYNDIDGVACAAHSGLMTDVLRGEWGFEGIVMADMFAIDRLQRAVGSPAHAGALALRAGLDMSMSDVSYVDLESAVQSGLATESDVDRACRRVLALKIRLGLLDEPRPAPSFPPPDPAPALAGAGTVLLSNRGLLPLRSMPRRVAVLGPNAADLDALLGDYVPPLRPGVGVTVLGGIQAALAAAAGRGVGTGGAAAADAAHEAAGSSAAGSPAGGGVAVADAEPVVAYERGCELTAPIEGGCERAARAAAAADLAVLVLGSSSKRGYEDDFQANGAADLIGTGGAVRPVATSGEGFDAAEVELPAAQRDLVAAVAAAGTPTVAIIVSGRPHGIGAVTAACDAVLYAWYPGPTGGTALAEVVLGGREPTGRLPVSLPRSSAVLPAAYNERLEVTARYVDAEAAAEHSFGAGLGYTTWALGRPAIDSAAPADPATAAVDPVAASGPAAAYSTAVADLARVSVSAAVTNTGSRPGTQVVQLYGRVLVAGRVPRRACLLGFTRLTAEPGAAGQVAVAIEADALPGLGIGPGETGTLLVWLSLTGAGEPADPLSVRFG
jgi:beta-glucosidase